MPDICSNRHKGNAHSREANRRVEPQKLPMRERILELIRKRGEITLFDACDVFGKYPSQISGRFTELKADRQIEETGSREVNGSLCAVYSLPRGQGRLF